MFEAIQVFATYTIVAIITELTNGLKSVFIIDSIPILDSLEKTINVPVSAQSDETR